MWDSAPSDPECAGSIREMDSSNLQLDVDHGQLIAVVAHELRYPLVPIRNAAALLKHNASDSATIHRAAGIIERQVTGMNRLIGDLVDVSRSQRGVIEMRRTRASLSDLLEFTAESAVPLVRERGHNLNVNTPQEAIYLPIDLMRVSQALLNIIANSTQYTDRLGVITVLAYREGAQAVIVVRDTGCGIPPRDLEAIFGLFAKSAQGMRVEQGLGIGLYLARHFIAAHGGTVTATSTGVGRGSEFTVRLPSEIASGESAPRDGAAIRDGRTRA